MKIDADRGGSPDTGPRPEDAAVSRDGWHMVETGAVLTLARRWPARFDVVAESRFPALHRRTLAHEVRKDVWRCLSRLRGFAPVVELRPAGGGLALRAGGQVDGPVPQGTGMRLQALLADPARRARWIAHAAPRGAAGSGAAHGATVCSEAAHGAAGGEAGR